MWVGKVAIEDFVETIDANFQPAQRLLQRFLKGAADRHDFADRFHLGGQSRIGLGKFLKIEAWHLGHDVVDTRFERGRGAPASNLVLQLIQGVAHRQFGRDLGNRETGGLGRQGRRTGNPGIHLNDDHAPIIGVDGKLDVRAPSIDANLAQHRQRGITHDLIFFVGQGLGWGDGNRVAGMHAHRIEVFNGANDNTVIGPVTDHLHFELFPA